jgi:hypothetical protein
VVVSLQQLLEAATKEIESEMEKIAQLEDLKKVGVHATFCLVFQSAELHLECHFTNNTDIGR